MIRSLFLAFIVLITFSLSETATAKDRSSRDSVIEFDDQSAKGGNPTKSKNYETFMEREAKRFTKLDLTPFHNAPVQEKMTLCAHFLAIVLNASLENGNLPLTCYNACVSYGAIASAIMEGKGSVPREQKKTYFWVTLLRALPLFAATWCLDNATELNDVRMTVFALQAFALSMHWFTLKYFWNNR